MTAEHLPLTATDILAAATDVLTSDALGDQAYVSFSGGDRAAWRTESVRLFEDRYGIVALVVYDTWSAMSTGWPDAQEALVNVISKHLSRSEAKAWEGYLVLMTPAPLPSTETDSAARIRYDTHRVRKLLATGDDLKSIADVRRVLLPLLPLELELPSPEQGSVLDLVSSLLSTRNIEPSSVQALIKAFREQQPLVEAIHENRVRK